MKHPVPLLALSLLGLAGCILTPTAGPLAPMSMRTEHTPPVPVRAEQITPENAEKMSQALAEELDRETQRGLTPAPLPK